MLHETVVQGQKEIGECILNRKAPDGKQKVHVMAHTRYGKSIIVGATVAIRAATKRERWAIVAPTKEDAQIIMDYVLWFSINDPIISELLKTEAKAIKEERLTQRRSRDHITYLNGGEVRTYSQKQTMGKGAPNIVLDEACLVEDEYEAKIFRMLGDNPEDFFIMKIGNPFYNNHFKRALLDDSYYHVNIDAKRGMAEGRLSEKILEEQKGKPFYDVLYWNIFPDEEARDKYGYLPLITHNMLERAQVDPESVDEVGTKKLGADPADGGQNESVAVGRSNNLGKILTATTQLGVLDFADDVAKRRHDYQEIHWDKQGVGSGGARRLEMAKETKRLLVKVNAGVKGKELEEMLPADEDVKDYANLRAYMFWSLKRWIDGGGKLAKDERWKNLLAVKYKTKDGQIQIIPKDLLRKPYYNIHDLGVADALSFTFNPQKPEQIYEQPEVGGGVQPYYPDIGV
jgi:hypothetical protein